MEINYTIDAWDFRKIGGNFSTRGYSIYDEPYTKRIYNVTEFVSGVIAPLWYFCGTASYNGISEFVLR